MPADAPACPAPRRPRGPSGRPSRRGGEARPAVAAVRRATSRLAQAAAVVVLLVQGPAAAGATTLECDGLRRLSDNYLLDLRIRLVFDTARRRYRRFEDAGRGWEEVATAGVYRTGRGERLVFDEAPTVQSYIERLTGTYYHIDPTGTTLSIWGHCAASGPPYPSF